MKPDAIMIEDVGHAVHSRNAPYLTVSGYVTSGPKCCTWAGKGPRRALIRLTRKEAETLGRALVNLAADEPRWPDEYGYPPDDTTAAS